MPCNQIILNKVKIEASNLELLTEAIKGVCRAQAIARGRLLCLPGAERNLAERISRSGFINLPQGQEFLADQIKQEYSRQTIAAAGRKLGWRISQKSPAKLLATRRA